MSSQFVRLLFSGFLCGNLCHGTLKSFQRIICLPANLFCDSVAYRADTDSVPISEGGLVGSLSVPDTALDADSAHIVANDSLQVQHGKRQSAEMDATGSAVAYAEAGAHILSLADIAGGGMQVEGELGDQDDIHVSERCSKSWKGDNVEQEIRCCTDVKMCNPTIERLRTPKRSITQNEAKELVSVTNARIKQDDLNSVIKGTFDVKEGVTPMVRKRFSWTSSRF